tara:strand:- start:120 stop:362 length:243 start_codon:yes stop_codon:yes gene_type:complete
MKYKIETKDEERKVYDDLFDHVMHLLNEHQMPVELVASTLMAIGQRLYRTHLTDKGYRALMDIIHDTPVEPYDVKKESIH